MKNLKLKFKLLTIIFLSFANSAWSFSTDDIVQKDLDSNIINEIEDAFLFNESENKTINKYINKADYQTKSEDSNPRFGFKTDNSSQKIDINKKTKERIAYNSYINGQYEVALKIYKDLVAKYPADNYPKYCLALTYQKLKQYKKAKLIYFELLKDNPKNKEEIVANLVTVLSQESPSRALFLLSKLANQNPNNGYFLAQKSLVLEQLERFDEAIIAMKEAIAIEPENIEFQLNLAIIYDQNKNFEEALMQYQRVLKSYNSYGDENGKIPVHQIVARIDIVKNLI